MTDTSVNTSTYRTPAESRETLRQRLLVSVLLGEHDQKTVTLEYDGYGDSGGPGACTIEDDETKDFLWDFVEAHHSGFWNNEGGRGTVTWNLTEDVITIDHNDVVEDHDNTTTVIGPDGIAQVQELDDTAKMRDAVMASGPLHMFLRSLVDEADARTAARLRELI